MSGAVSLHTHTSYCDGTACPEKMVIAAIDKGLSAIGFSGHSYTSFDLSCCMSLENTEKYIADINDLKHKYAGKIDILCGIEQDYFADFAAERFDYVIGSVHMLKKNGKYICIDESKESFVDAVRNYWNGDYYALAEDYYTLVSDVVNKTGADIIGHFDLITKFNEGGTLFDESNPRYVKAAVLAMEALVKTGVPFEINTGGVSRGYRKEPYPSEFLLRTLFKLGGKVIITSDSHAPETLDFGFKEALELAERCGFKADDIQNETEKIILRVKKRL